MKYRIYQYTLAFDAPFKERTGLLLHLEESDKWGEIAPFPGRNRETLAEALSQLKNVFTSPCASVPLFPSVAFGLYAAMHYRSVAQPVPVCALLAGTPEQIWTQAEVARAQGYTCAKIKISGMPLAIAAELINTLSALFSLRIDANRALSFKEAMDLCAHCARVEYIEEPTYELSQLEHFSYPFALDESLLDLSLLPQTPYFTTLIFKPSVMGGYAECLAYAKRTGKKIALSSACETGIGILGIASLATTLPWEMTPLGLGTHRFLQQDILASPLDFASSALALPPVIHVNTHLLREIAHG